MRLVKHKPEEEPESYWPTPAGASTPNNQREHNHLVCVGDLQPKLFALPHSTRAVAQQLSGMPCRLKAGLAHRDKLAPLIVGVVDRPAMIAPDTMRRLFPADATRESVDPLGLKGVTLDQL